MLTEMKWSRERFAGQGDILTCRAVAQTKRGPVLCQQYEFACEHGEAIKFRTRHTCRGKWGLWGKWYGMNGPNNPEWFAAVRQGVAAFYAEEAEWL